MGTILRAFDAALQPVSVPEYRMPVAAHFVAHRSRRNDRGGIRGIETYQLKNRPNRLTWLPSAFAIAPLMWCLAGKKWPAPFFWHSTSVFSVGALAVAAAKSHFGVCNCAVSLQRSMQN
jgi:hypothetical protein